MMHVLVTGGAGYIGTNLTAMLLHEGHRVTVLDRFFFGDTLADLAPTANLHQVRKDIRDVTPRDFAGVDAVCDLAAISNDPAGELDPAKTLEINHLGRAKVSRAAKEAGVRRYVLASSCSIYGFQDHVVDETSPTNPLTTYALANERAEQSTLPLNDRNFTATALRQATVYGPSRRMRFDLVVNAMALDLHRGGRLRIMRDGTQWRPFVHVQDTCRAFLATLAADADRVGGQTINVGSDEQNLQVKDLAEAVARGCGAPPGHDWYGDVDRRSYRVAFRKARDLLRFSPAHTPEDGAREVAAGLRDGTLCPGPETRTVEWYKHLISARPAEVMLDDRVL